MKKLNLISILFQVPNPIFYDLSFYCINFMAIYLGHYKGLNWLSLIIMFVLGVFTWELLEYLIHRYIFHMKTDNIHFRKIVFAIHGVHHAHSHDNDKMFVPFVPAIFMASILLYVLNAILGDFSYPFFAGIIFMHQIYNYIHVIIHTNKFPNSKILKRLRENHIKHHHGYGEKCFGVTSTICDKLFKTL